MAPMNCTTMIQGYGGSYAQNTCLPHTGFPVLTVVLIAVALLLLGVGLRLLTR